MAIDIHWSGLAQVVEVSAVFAIGAAVIFTVGVLGLSRAEDAQERGEQAGGTGARGTGTGGTGSGGARGPGLAVAVLAFAACAALVVYGLYLLIPQFH